MDLCTLILEARGRPRLTLAQTLSKLLDPLRRLCGVRGVPLTGRGSRVHLRFLRCKRDGRRQTRDVYLIRGNWSGVLDDTLDPENLAGASGNAAGRNESRERISLFEWFNDLRKGARCEGSSDGDAAAERPDAQGNAAFGHAQAGGYQGKGAQRMRECAGSASAQKKRRPKVASCFHRACVAGPCATSTTGVWTRGGNVGQRLVQHAVRPVLVCVPRRATGPCQVRARHRRKLPLPFFHSDQLTVRYTRRRMLELPFACKRSLECACSLPIHCVRCRKYESNWMRTCSSPVIRACAFHSGDFLPPSLLHPSLPPSLPPCPPPPSLPISGGQYFALLD
jgi:hypothetical protein